jgi:hypothetical protein
MVQKLACLVAPKGESARHASPRGCLRPGAEVSLREPRVCSDPAGKATLVQGHPNDNPNAVLEAGGKQSFRRLLVKHVVDHLYGVDEPAGHESQRIVRLEVIDGDAEQANFTFVLQLLDGFPPVAPADPTVVPHVKLEHVEAVEAGRGKARVEARADVVARKCLTRVETDRWRKTPFLGGTFVATCSPWPRCARTTSPTIRSLSP